MIQRGYTNSVLSLVGLAVCASERLAQWLQNPWLLASAVIALSASLASSISFQFYQVPNMVSSTAFREHKAVCLAFLDGIGFFLTAPIWTLSSRVVQSFGWSTTWCLLAILVGSGGALMISALQPVLSKQQQEASH